MVTNLNVFMNEANRPYLKKKLRKADKRQNGDKFECFHKCSKSSLFEKNEEQLIKGGMVTNLNVFTNEVNRPYLKKMKKS